VGESRVSSEKRGDLCGIGGFQGKIIIYQTNMREKANLREDFSEEKSQVLDQCLFWPEYLGFKETSLGKGLQN